MTNIFYKMYIIFDILRKQGNKAMKHSGFQGLPIPCIGKGFIRSLLQVSEF
jgi:hypothetical protein